jgi:hypothetical protein
MKFRLLNASSFQLNFLYDIIFYIIVAYPMIAGIVINRSLDLVERYQPNNRLHINETWNISRKDELVTFRDEPSIFSLELSQFDYTFR